MESIIPHLAVMKSYKNCKPHKIQITYSMAWLQPNLTEIYILYKLKKKEKKGVHKT